MKLCWWTLSKIYEELKDIFDEHKQGFDSKSRTLSHIFTFLRDVCIIISLFLHKSAKSSISPSQSNSIYFCIEYIFIHVKSHNGTERES